MRRPVFRLTPFRIIVLGFAALILAGTLLLMLPVSRRAPGSAGFADSLFTAVSAVCVTGLVVQDTATFWSSFGQAVILLLIQVGGLGVVTAAVSISYLSGKKIGLMQRSTMQESVAAPQVGGIVRLTRFIVCGSLLIELIGAALLAPVFLRSDGLIPGLWHALFTAVSAFCNAGFDLMGARGTFSSMTSFEQHPAVNLVLMALITVGGAGFLVWNDVRTYRLRFKKYRLQSKVALVTSLCLVVFPACWFFLTEMQWLPAGRRFLPALFQSVSLRTAGFNTVDLSRMSTSGQAVMIFCMLTGGSPGSTAGGMKTTTVAVLLLAARSVYQRSEHVRCLGRRISGDTVRQAVAIVVMYFALCFAGGVAISRLEGLPLMACLFETASAVGTVGLTLGYTSRLGLVSRGILALLMFFGRVGGLTLIYAAQPLPRPEYSQLPLEKITVG